MKTIRMEIEETLLTEIDRTVRTLGKTRSQFICDALRMVLRQPTIETLERQHANGYKKYPVAAEEFNGWETEQVWGDE